MRRNPLAPLYHKLLLNDMTDTTRLTVATRHDHWDDNDDIGIAYYYRHDLNSLLLWDRYDASPQTLSSKSTRDSPQMLTTKRIFPD